MLRLFPFLRWPRPTLAALRKDAWAGLSVGLVLIPQSLAYATLAGMPPETGLYAALLPAVIGILWGSSPLLAVGPVALTSLLTFASLLPFATPESAEWVQLAIWLAIYSGLIQFLLGGLRLGMIANFVSYPVIVGFISAAALIIIFSQIPPFLGLPGVEFSARWLHLAAASVHDAPLHTLQTAVFGAGALLMLMLQRRWAPRLPGVLLVCLGGIGASALLGLAHNGIDVVGQIPGGFPHFGTIPALTLEQHLALLPAAVIIALISFTEAMSSCRTLARDSDQIWDENQELIGQGLAKIASGASGAFPVSGSFSRSALNAYVGATSGWSALFTSVCVLACLLWATDYLYHLPRAILAAIIIVPVIGLVDYRTFRRLWRTARADAVVALTTFAATLASAPYLHWGVLAGLVASLLCFLYKISRPRLIEVSLHADGTLRDRQLYALPPLAPDVLAVRMDSALIFVTAPLLERFIMGRARHATGLRTVLLCCAPINHIDATGVEGLLRLERNLAGLGISLKLSAVKQQLQEVLLKTGIRQQFGEAAFFATDRAAIEALSARPELRPAGPASR